MNMLLHGIPDADIRNGDTLAEPMHTDGGELMRFNRVLTNPPFSQNSWHEIVIHVSCREDAAVLADAVPYALAVTLEVDEAMGVDIYTEIQDRVQAKLRIAGGV
jgi:hypothetical protein